MRGREDLLVGPSDVVRIDRAACAPRATALRMHRTQHASSRHADSPWLQRQHQAHGIRATKILANNERIPIAAAANTTAIAAAATTTAIIADAVANFA